MSSTFLTPENHLIRLSSPKLLYHQSTLHATEFSYANCWHQRALNTTIPTATPNSMFDSWTTIAAPLEIPGGGEVVVGVVGSGMNVVPVLAGLAELRVLGLETLNPALFSPYPKPRGNISSKRTCSLYCLRRCNSHLGAVFLKNSHGVAGLCCSIRTLSGDGF